ncbi:MAG: hydantoinase B/oxoprolinase family protein [Natronomonas sp.]
MRLDAVTLEVLRNQLAGVAEEMGHVLIHGAYSPNIKERQDCSTALFDAEGRMVAQAEHIPVHLGAMPEAVEAIRDLEPTPGDAYVLNDPFTGGTHLPDVTIVAPIDVDDDLLGYGVTRAHHGDVGGMTPGSMPAGATEIYQEGLRIPAIRLSTDGQMDDDVLSLLLANMRNPSQRRADLRAQLAATERATERIRELVADHGRDTLSAAFDSVIEYSQQRIETELEAMPDGVFTATDSLEGDGVTETDVPIEVAVTIDGSQSTVDFAGTADQVAGNMNAPRAVAKSAVYFVVRAVTDPEIPPNEGCYRPVDVEIPTGSVLDPKPPAAVVGGNVETSQRVTDVVLSAFGDAIPDRIPAQGQGTMNNLVVGSREADGFTYYETIGGGFGGRPTCDGIDGVQVGMTNTLNTPIEALEAEYPMRVERYGFREGSGGDGEFRGGLGLVRSITIEADATVSLLTERRRLAPRGLAGGNDGKPGKNQIDGEVVPAKTTLDVPAGTTITIETPGGGGYGDPHRRDAAARRSDLFDGKTDEIE